MAGLRILAALLGLVSTSFALTTSSINPTCAAVSKIVSVLHAYPSVSPFCSSFLHYTTSTQTITSTTTQTVSSVAVSTAITTSTILSGITATTSTVVTQTVNNPITQIITITAAPTTVTAPPVISTVTNGATNVCVDITVPPSPINKRGLTTVKSSSLATSKPVSTLATITKASSVPASSSSSLPTCVVSFASSAISSACSCLGIPLPTTTVTTTSTAKATAVSSTVTTTTVYTTIFSTSTLVNTLTATATANSIVIAPTTVTPATTTTPTSVTTVLSTISSTPSGLQYAVYQNLPGDEGDNQYSSFDPTYFKTQQPEQSGIINQVGPFDFNSSPVQIYGGAPIPLNSFVVDHRGYLIAPQSGTYTINLGDIDDIILIWHGPIAYSGWNRGNADFVATYPNFPVNGNVFTLSQGQYYPIRIMFGQAEGGTLLDVTITAPDGSTIIINGQTTNYVVTGSCDGTTAPPFEPYGAET